MSQTNIPITQLAQVGLAEKLVYEAQSHPEIQRQAAQQAAPEILRRESDSVEKNDAAEKSQSLGIRDRKERGKREKRKEARERREAKSAEEEYAPSSPDSPWSGNLLNLKV